MMVVRYQVGKVTESACKYILNIVNCLGVIGADSTKEIHEKYPEEYNKYIRACARNEFSTDLGGKVQFAATNDDKVVINLFAQYGCGTEKDHINYTWLVNCLEKIDSYIPSGKVLAADSNIGVGGVTGGDKRIIRALFERTIQNHGLVWYDSNQEQEPTEVEETAEEE